MSDHLAKLSPAAREVAAKSGYTEEMLDDLNPGGRERLMKGFEDDCRNRYVPQSDPSVEEPWRARLRERRAAHGESRRGPTNGALAAKLGVSERHVITLRKSGTSSRDMAARMAEHLGGEPSDYLRARRHRGRERRIVPWMMEVGAEDYPFRDFIMQTNEAIDKRDENSWLEDGAESDDKHFEQLVSVLHGLYILDRKVLIPDDFRTMEELSNAARDTEIELRDSVPRLWKKFKLWRIAGVNARAVFEVEDEHL